MVVEWRDSASTFRTFSSGARKKPLAPPSFTSRKRPDRSPFLQKLGSISSFDAERPQIESAVAFPTPEADSIACEALRELDEFQNLTPDWDSYGARSIAPDAIATARRLLMALQDDFSTMLGDRLKPFDVAPIATGGVQLEWRGGGGRVIEVEITPESELRYLIVEPSAGRPRYKQGTNASPAEILAQVERILSS
jgi:hypothetical protein